MLFVSVTSFNQLFGGYTSLLPYQELDERLTLCFQYTKSVQRAQTMFRLSLAQFGNDKEASLHQMRKGLLASQNIFFESLGFCSKMENCAKLGTSQP